jgi:hypothetical protein
LSEASVLAIGRRIPFFMPILEVKNVTGRKIGFISELSIDPTLTAEEMSGCRTN